MYPKWGNTRVAPQLGGRHDIEKILNNTQGPAPHGQKEPKRPEGKKAATQNDMGADQGESSGWADEVEAFD
jgi:hypothetical protein